jgi:hypothetical protein
MRRKLDRAGSLSIWPSWKGMREGAEPFPVERMASVDTSDTQWPNVSQK